MDILYFLRPIFRLIQIFIDYFLGFTHFFYNCHDKVKIELSPKILEKICFIFYNLMKNGMIGN